MPRSQLQPQPDSPYTFAWAQYVGQGSEGFGATLAWGPGNDVLVIDDVNWVDFVRGSSNTGAPVCLQWLGYAGVSAGGNLNRFLPARCPMYDWMWCKGISGIPKIWSNKAIGDVFHDGQRIIPYSDFDHCRVTMHFGPPPTAYLSDAQLASQFPFTSTQLVSQTGAQNSTNQVTVTDSSTLYPGLNITGPGIPPGTTVVGFVPAPPPNVVILSNAVNLPLLGQQFAFINPLVGAEQFRFCYWHEEPQLRVGQRNIGAFEYTEQDGHFPRKGPFLGQKFVGFVPVQEKYTDITAEWWFVPDAYIRSSKPTTLKLPVNFNLCHGCVNSLPFVTPIGIFPAGTLLLKTWSIEPQEAPVPIPGIPHSGPMVLRKVVFKFSYFNPPKSPSASHQGEPLTLGHNNGWATDGYYYGIQTSVGLAPPFPSADMNLLFQISL